MLSAPSGDPKALQALRDPVLKVLEAAAREDPFPEGTDLDCALDAAGAEALGALAGLHGGKMAWDLGTFTGISAAVLSEHMKVVTVEREATLASFARKHLPKTVRVVEGEVMAFLRNQAADGKKADFIFLDVDFYAECYEIIMTEGLLRPGGVLAAPSAGCLDGFAQLLQKDLRSGAVAELAGGELLAVKLADAKGDGETATDETASGSLSEADTEEQGEFPEPLQTRTLETQKAEAKVFQFTDVLQPQASEALMAALQARPEGYSALNNTAMVPQAPWGVGESLPRADGEAAPRPWFVPTPDGKQWVYHPALYGALRADYRTAQRVDAATLKGLLGYNPTSAGPIVRGEVSLTDPAFEPLVQHPEILAAAGRLHERHPLVVPLGAFANLTMPGCSSQMHTDAVEFRGHATYVGANGAENPFPGWLTVCMQRSGLFRKYELRIATVVYYPCPPASGDKTESAGDLLLFADGPTEPATRHKASFNTAACCNNTKVWHLATHAARTEAAKVHAPPRSRAAVLAWSAGRERWVLTEPDGRELAAYTTDDLRMSIQIKVGCFQDAADLARYQNHTDDMDLTVDQVFEVLSADLAARGLLDPANPPPRSPTPEDPERYTLQDLCLDTYATPPAAELVDACYRTE